MRMKNEDISTANLNPIFTQPLKKFDELHTELMGNQAVVTSTDTGKHWGGIERINRPTGWEKFSEAKVRTHSKSKHYTKPLCDALDLRRRCPDGKLTYFDDLTQSQQEYFRAEINECFPDKYFDVVFSRLCIHVEIDIDFDVRKPRKLTDEDLEPRTKGWPGAMISKEIEPIKLKKPKFNLGILELINWKNMPKALMSGVFRYFTKFNLFLQVHKPNWIDKLIELLRTLINKLTKKGK